MKRYDLLLAVLHYFASHVTSEQCFATTDGQLFHGKDNAITHSRETLGNNTVEHFERTKLESYEAEAKGLEGKELPTGAALLSNVDQPADYSTWKKPALEAELTKRGIKFEMMATNAVKAQLLANDDAEKAKA